MNDTPLQQALLLHSLPDLTPTQLCAALLRAGSLPDLLVAEPSLWASVGAPALVYTSLQRALRSPDLSAEAAQVSAWLTLLKPLNVEVLSIVSANYPPLLAAISNPPPLLYIRGDSALLSAPQVAMVGSRRATAAGRRLARTMAADLATAGLVVTSGLALGIDGEAHQGALSAGGRSVAVMATGIEQLYPKRHQALGATLIEQGCVISEFAPGTPPLPPHFPRRNRIVSGLSLGTVVVEAALPSGSLLTAALALEQGREVMACPHTPGTPGARGCHRLLRDGAIPVADADDILFALQHALPRPDSPPQQVGVEPQAPAPAVDEAQQAVLDLLGAQPVSLDALQQHSQRDTPELMILLTELELAGRVSRCSVGYRLV